MKRTLQLGGILACLSFAFLCIVLSVEAVKLWPAVSSIAGHINQTTANAERASGQLATVSAQLADKKTGVMAILSNVPPMVTDAAKREIGHAIDSLMLIAKEALALSGQKIDATLQRADAVIELAQNVRGDLKPTLDHAASITGQVNDTAPLFLDCEFNPDCVFNRFQGTSKALEQMAQAAAKAAPEVSASVEGISNSAEGIASDAKREADLITKPKHWYEKILGPAYTIARIVWLFF